VVQTQEVRTLLIVLVGFLNSRSMETKCKILSNILLYSMSLSVTPPAWHGMVEWLMIDEFGGNLKINVCVLNEILFWQFTLKTEDKYWRTSLTVFENPTEIMTRRLQHY